MTAAKNEPSRRKDALCLLEFSLTNITCSFSRNVRFVSNEPPTPYHQQNLHSTDSTDTDGV